MGLVLVYGRMWCWMLDLGDVGSDGRVVDGIVQGLMRW